MVGASAALIISEIPFVNPVGGVRVGRVNGQLVVNPPSSSAPTATSTCWWPAPLTPLVMVECGAKEVLEADMVKAWPSATSRSRSSSSCRRTCRPSRQAKVTAIKAVRNEALYKEVAAAYAEQLFAASP